MARVHFTDHLKRRLGCEDREVSGQTVMEALASALQSQDRLAGYVLDDQKRLRKHVTVFVNGKLVRDRTHLCDPIQADDEIYVMQALSGG